jgi:hypothetical protein
MSLCGRCDGTSWILYFKDAPSPPYKEGCKLEYGVRCPDCHEPKRNRENQQDESINFSTSRFEPKEY